MDGSLLGPAEVLFERAASIRAVRGEQMNRFSRALAALKQSADRTGTPVAIVGGLAGIHHGALVTTVDIDVVVPCDKIEQLVHEASRHGITLKKHSASGRHILEFADVEAPVEIHIVPEGEKSPRDPDYAPPTPGPQQLGVESGLGYASLAGWALLKLVAARDKDRYHLTEALKHATEEQISQIVVALRPLHPSYLEELERLLRNAQSERQDDW